MAARVIVFGPTGDVASIAARTAQRYGAKVFLAMRNIAKPIPGLSREQEMQGGFERVQADLTQPQSVQSAVRTTGATAAFMYLAWAADDHMKATFEASRMAGIDFVVFLSSFTIPRDEPLDRVQSEDRIPFMHARAEMELDTVYGSNNYVALRPGAFAANTRQWRFGIADGNVQVDNPETKYDYITPEDMGAVAGNLLVNGRGDERHVLYLYGPQLLAQKDAIHVALKGLGRNAVTDSNQTQNPSGGHEEHKDVLVRLGPQSAASHWFERAYGNFQEGVENVERYTGRAPIRYQEWVEGNGRKFEV